MLYVPVGYAARERLADNPGSLLHVRSIVLSPRSRFQVSLQETELPVHAHIETQSVRTSEAKSRRSRMMEKSAGSVQPLFVEKNRRKRLRRGARDQGDFCLRRGPNSLTKLGCTPP